MRARAPRRRYASSHLIIELKSAVSWIKANEFASVEVLLFLLSFAKLLSLFP